MSEWLNLTEDQRKRMEEAESAEEKAAVIREAVGEPRELSLEELEAVSGGNQEVVIPSTHEEIDAYWDAVESYGKDNVLAATLLAYELKLIPWRASVNDHCTMYLSISSVASERAMMHRMLDGKKG
ncbi:MAG: hypothetical protein J6S63_07260 [Atopobiaceae bacterium]|nr:hypothetical protein [Atopobiaceae bacterium]